MLKFKNQLFKSLRINSLYRNYSKEKLRKFDVDGGMHHRDKHRYFYINPEESNKKHLIPSIQEGLYIMFYGPRGIGKSTNINQVCKQLQDEYCCLFVTFQQGISFENKKDFWSTFGRALQLGNPHVGIPKISSASDFSNFLDISNKEKLFGRKNVVMFGDEFDLLYKAKDESVVDDLLNVLQGIRETRQSYLHSFVGIGQFHLAPLIGRCVSPFDPIRSPKFEEKEVIELFQQVQEDYGEILDDRIPIDIFQRTSGHRGLTGLCGARLLETIRQKGFVSYEDWIRYVSRELERGFPLRIPTSEKERDLLWTHFLPSNSPVHVTPQEEDLARLLTAEGALVDTDDACEYDIPSPLVRNFLLNQLIHEFPLEKDCKEPIPFQNDGGTIDIPSLFLKAVQSIDRNYIFRSSKYSIKEVEIRGPRFVPDVNFYHCGLFHVFSQWFSSAPECIEIINEIDAPIFMEKSKGCSSSKRRCDLIIDLFKGLQRYAIEIFASETDEELRNRIANVQNYAKALGAHECWIIHFVATIEFDAHNLAHTLVWPGQGANVNIMYIFHDLYWKEAILVTRTTEMEIQQTKFSLD